MGKGNEVKNHVIHGNRAVVRVLARRLLRCIKPRSEIIVT